MKQTKKLALILATLTFLAVFFMFGASAEERTVVETGSCGIDGDNVTYVLYDDGELIISGTGDMYDYKYISSDSPWRGSDKIKEIVISEGVTSVGFRAFEGCSAEKLTLADTVTKIGAVAFANCYNLEDVYIPENVDTIEYYAFIFEDTTYTKTPKLKAINVSENNKTFSSIDGVLFNKDRTEMLQYPAGKTDKEYMIPDTVKTIGSDAFHDCSVEKVTIPESVTAIGDQAFMLSDITSIVIPESVTTLGTGAFADCFYLRNVVIPGSITSLPMGAFYFNLRLKTVYVCEGVTEISGQAFAGCMTLETLTLPNTLISVGESAFELCPMMKNVYLKGTDTVLSDSLLCMSKNIISGNVTPEQEETLITETLKSEDPLDRDITETAKSAGIESVYYEEPQPIGTIHGYIGSTAETYANENGITFVELTDEDSAVEFIDGYYTYTVTDGYATIVDVDDTISGDVVIPSTLGGYPVVAIGDEAFSQSFNITSVVVPAGVKELGRYAFEHSTIKTIDLPDSLEKICYGAFAWCVYLESIELPEGLKFLDGAVFFCCTRLESIVIPQGITQIGSETFHFCVSLKNIQLPTGLTYLAGFRGCYSLESIEIPDTVETLYLFDSCYSLKELNLPSSVKNLKSLFTDCISLENVYVNNSETDFSQTDIGFNTFSIINGTKEELIDLSKEYYFAQIPGTNLEEVSAKMEEIESRIDAIISYNDKDIVSDILTIHGHSGSTAETYAKENGIKFEVLTESTTITDSNTNVEVEFDNSVFESEVELVVSEEEINANIVFGNDYESYKAYDISLESNGEKVQPDGYVTVKLPIPEGFNAETTVVYYVAPDGTKTKLDSRTENGYIIFETNHFSEYVIVDESSKIEAPHVHNYSSVVTAPTCIENGTKTYTCSCGNTYTETIEATGHDFDGSKCKNCDFDKAAECGCNCHKGGFMGFIWKIINFFQKLFRMNPVCECGMAHY